MHATRLRVRFDEVDSMGVVHHPRYLVYFEVARTDWFHAMGAAYRDLMARGTHLAVVDASARYLRPARYDDELVVETRLTEVRGASATFRYVVRRGDETIATGHTRLGSIDPAGSVKRFPDDLARRFRAAVEPDAEDPARPGVQSRA